MFYLYKSLGSLLAFVLDIIVVISFGIHFQNFISIDVHVSSWFIEAPFIMTIKYQSDQNSELRILFNIIHEDCNKLVIVTIIKITVIKGKKYETKYIILF